MTQEEGGIRPQRVEFVRETTTGEFNADPSWNLYSDVMRSLSWAATPAADLRRALGDVDPSEVHSGPEAHEVTVSYDLQQFLVDGSGDAVDAAGDGVLRQADNALEATHTMVAREELDGIPASETVNGSTSHDTRLYLVMVGGRIGTVNLTGDPGSDQPIQVELTYTAEKVREYRIDQPTAAGTIDVVSSDAGDTTQTVTIQGTSDGTTPEEETVNLNGTTPATTTASFATIDAIELDASTSGDVTVSESGGDDLAIIRGSDYYGWPGTAGEGDLGVPALGAGSHASALGSAYELILDDTIERPGGTSIGYEINSVEFNVENNLETREAIGTPRMSISAGPRDATMTATVVGPTESVQTMEQSLSSSEANLIWTLTGGTIQLDNAVLTGPGDISKEVDQASMALDNEFTGQGVTVST